MAIKMYFGYTSLKNYMPKNIKPVSKRNNITCGCKTRTSALLLQSYLNKWRLSQLDKLDKLYIIYASTILLRRSYIDFI